MRYPIGYVRPCNRHLLPGPEREHWDEWDAENGVLEQRLREQEYDHRQRQRRLNRRWVPL